ncbi:MAG: RluA family pseudouridine synthase [Verrucomicrobiota bacterium]|nr:RluA family pseudouridine synthase [Verrucomicrobiota bacterium]
MKSSDNAIPDIIYCDNHILLAVKPAGWLTQPDDTSRECLETYAKEWVKKQYNKPGNVFLHCIHRLDRSVSGLVLFARTSKALSRLNQASRDQEIRRLYRAEVHGILPNKEGLLQHYLAHAEHHAMIVKPSHPEAKKATLSYRVEKFLEHTTLVEIQLHTGRYHQIRAQFGAIGHPIVGDIRYGEKKGSGEEIRLACTDLFFKHPVTGEELTFHTDAPF